MGYEACLREAGYDGYDVIWVHGSAMTMERFANETIANSTVRPQMYDSKFTKMGVAYGEVIVSSEVVRPYFVVYVLK